ncbi:hypothetical protein BUALT_Bualt02G0206500 [Buddleja alternifolia]|uniref:CDT1 Geminin-binding domain-containing protein n=1 Tax=Buddleja alternifolia TaxID=168488 RepID=A0AAV6Y3C7_9LAMI|nr:hypothetical protein BUALT_Bualt02G0206500 [Buddleja alternifolia]
MDSSKSSSPLSSFKSKKQLHSPAPSDQKTRKVSDPDPNPWSVKTPGKPVDPPRRSRHGGSELSIKEIRQAALKLREGGSDRPTRTDPLLEPEREPIAASKKKSVNAEITLPEKYELLDKFFNSLDSSIRLLQLKRSATTFTNISSQIGYLTDRRFTHSHLAQLKFIMPEAIVIEKVLQHDERTSCMKPDLRISLDIEAIESKSKSKSCSRNLLLRKVFRGRLLDFSKSHPEGDEVPEEALPAPFSRMKEDASANSVRLSSSSLMSETPAVASSEQQPAAASHVSLSFKKRFSQRGSAHHIENLKQDHLGITSHPPIVPEPKFAKSPSGKEKSAIALKSPMKLSNEENCSSYKASPCSKPSSPFPETPVKFLNSIKGEDQCATPVELASTPAKLMSATPMLHTPKRCYMSPEDNSSRTPSKLIRRPPANRPLKFDTPVKNVKVDDEIFDILPEALLESIREKERKASMEHDPAISQAKWRRKMIASLPKLFDMIYFIFQSIRRSVVTKEELIQKIITGHLDVVDRREVEEQLRLLQELAPEWIYEKLALSGDLLLCVNKISGPEAIRTRLAEAK